jgi:hypothetical protein
MVCKVILNSHVHLHIKVDLDLIDLQVQGGCVSIFWLWRVKLCVEHLKFQPDLEISMVTLWLLHPTGADFLGFEN